MHCCFFFFYLFHLLLFPLSPFLLINLYSSFHFAYFMYENILKKTPSSFSMFKRMVADSLLCISSFVLSAKMYFLIYLIYRKNLFKKYFAIHRIPSVHVSDEKLMQNAFQRARYINAYISDIWYIIIKTRNPWTKKKTKHFDTSHKSFYKKFEYDFSRHVTIVTWAHVRKKQLFILQLKKINHTNDWHVNIWPPRILKQDKGIVSKLNLFVYLVK